MPSPVGQCSRKITCPLFSPPRMAPDSAIPTQTDRSPTGVRTSEPPRPRSVGLDEAAVRQNRRDQGATIQRASGQAVEGQHPRETRIAVDDGTRLVHHHASVGVTIEREADVRSGSADRVRQGTRRGRAARFVDVSKPVGAAANVVTRAPVAARMSAANALADPLAQSMTTSAGRGSSQRWPCGAPGSGPARHWPGPARQARDCQARATSPLGASVPRADARRARRA